MIGAHSMPAPVSFCDSLPLLPATVSLCDPLPLLPWPVPDNAYPFSFRPHYAQYTDPVTGDVSKIIVVPSAMGMSWQDGYVVVRWQHCRRCPGSRCLSLSCCWSLVYVCVCVRACRHCASYECYGSQDMATIAAGSDPAHPNLVVLAHDGDNDFGEAWWRTVVCCGVLVWVRRTLHGFGHWCGCERKPVVTPSFCVWQPLMSAFAVGPLAGGGYSYYTQCVSGLVGSAAAQRGDHHSAVPARLPRGSQRHRPRTHALGPCGVCTPLCRGADPSALLNLRC